VRSKNDTSDSTQLYLPKKYQDLIACLKRIASHSAAFMEERSIVPPYSLTGGFLRSKVYQHCSEEEHVKHYLHSKVPLSTQMRRISNHNITRIQQLIQVIHLSLISIYQRLEESHIIYLN